MIAALAALLSASAIAAPAAPPCGPPKAHTLAGSSRARVYTGARGVVEGCLRGHAPVALGRTQRFSATLDHFVLSGSAAAFAQSAHGIDTSSAGVVLVSLRSGRRLKSFAAAAPPARPESFVSVTELLIAPGSRLAWIASSSAIGLPRARYEVHLDARLLDGGPNVAPRSLSIGQGRISWTDGGVRRSAAIS